MLVFLWIAGSCNVNLLLCGSRFNTILVIPAGRVRTSKNSDSSVACQKFVQSILELPATDEIHMEDRKKVWPELSPDLIRPMAYVVRKAVINSQSSCAKTATFESRTNKMKNVSEENITR